MFPVTNTLKRAHTHTNTHTHIQTLAQTHIRDRQTVFVADLGIREGGRISVTKILIILTSEIILKCYLI